MARPVKITPEVLLEAARAVFIEKGFSATTAEVAERAGVSEGILFHRFGSKAGLFRAAMSHEVRSMIVELDLDERIGRGEIEVELARLVTDLIVMLKGLMPRIMMSWSNRAEGGFPPELREPNPPPLRVLKALIAYFEAEMVAGRLRTVDPEVLARACLGGAMHYVFVETLGALHGRMPLPESVYVRGLVDILLSGVGVAAGAPRGPDPAAASSLGWAP